MREQEEQELMFTINHFLKDRESLRNFVNTIFESSGISQQSEEKLKDCLVEVWDIVISKFPEVLWDIEVVVVGKGGTFREIPLKRGQLLIPDISDENEDYIRWYLACLTAHAVLQYWNQSPVNDQAAELLARSWGFSAPKKNDEEEV